MIGGCVRTRNRGFRPAAACVAVLVAVVLAACGDDAGAPAAGADGVPSAAGYPVTIENCGRTLTFDTPPSRAVLPYHPIAEIVVGLGLADRAIGRYGYQGAFPAAPLLPDQCG